MKKILVNTGKGLLLMVSGLLLMIGVMFLLASCKKEKNDTNLPALGSGPLTMLPNSGDAGTLVTITGNGFSPNVADDAVLFNGMAADIVNATSTQLVVQAPRGATTGIVQVTVNGKSVSIGTYTFQTLSIHAIEPANGPTGTNIKIIGAGFGNDISPASVTINGASAKVISAADTLLIAAVPNNSGTGPVVVTVNGQTATGPVFTYQAITAISPVTGGAGTVINISGMGFNTTVAQDIVAVNGVSAVVKSATATTIVATLQPGVTTGQVSVTINGQRTIGPVFTVVPPPAIASLSPSSGLAGVQVTIHGTNFSTNLAENQVTFNGVPAVISSATTAALVVNAPANVTTGKVVVTTNNQVSAGVLFTVQSLGISALSPDNGLDGTVVTITGTGFNTTPSQNMVYFNGVQATVTSATATQLVVTAPAGTTTGVVTVNTNGLTATGPVFSHAGVQTLVGGPKSTVFSRDLRGLAIDNSGNLYVVNTGAYNILKITPAGAVSVFAGSPSGKSGYQDADGTQALFGYSDGLTIDSNGNLFLADITNNAVREITPSGHVTTYSGNLGYGPEYLAFDPQGSMYVSQFSSTITKYLANGLMQTVSTQANNNQFALDAAGNVYYGGAYDAIVHKVNPSLNDTRFAGSWQSGFADGAYGTGQFSNISGIAVDPTTQNLIVSDQYNNAIRMVTPDGTITTIAGGGNYTGQSGYKDGALSSALFRSPGSVAIDKNGIIYVIDYYNHAIRKIALK